MLLACGLRGWQQIKHTQKQRTKFSFHQGFPLTPRASCSCRFWLDRGPEERPLGRKQDQGQWERGFQTQLRKLYSISFISLKHRAWPQSARNTATSESGSLL